MCAPRRSLGPALRPGSPRQAGAPGRLLCAGPRARPCRLRDPAFPRGHWPDGRAAGVARAVGGAVYSKGRAPRPRPGSHFGARACVRVCVCGEAPRSAGPVLPALTFFPPPLLARGRRGGSQQAEGTLPPHALPRPPVATERPSPPRGDSSAWRRTKGSGERPCAHQ